MSRDATISFGTSVCTTSIFSFACSPCLGSFVPNGHSLALIRPLMAIFLRPYGRAPSRRCFLWPCGCAPSRRYFLQPCGCAPSRQYRFTIRLTAIIDFFFRLTAILFNPPHGGASRQFFFSRLVAVPQGKSFSPALRRRLTAILFLPPCSGASRGFFFSRLAGAPHGDSFSPALLRRLTAILFLPPHGGTSPGKILLITHQGFL